MALYTISNSINKLRYQVAIVAYWLKLHVVISNSGVTRIAPSLDTIDTSTYILKRSRMTRKQLMYQDVQASSDSCQHT
ncbi:hypothetical protein ZWY2020_027919 [Hordeum vulgare]|nr:hypothetical protein ZWY2020_027919 [Hordeum vulgare]